ncbi:MAG TPA: hypothetical protein VGO47_14800 [Chlamydiales bacterium]|jgi:hypothetical protein|nr:hypothetical protein [Chlamydiales bacterium]
MRFDELIPRRTNRVFLTGMTGSGKSVLAKQLLESRESVLIFDAKDDIKWKGYKRFSKLSNLISANPVRAIYAPNIHELDDKRYHDWFCKFAFERQKKFLKKKLFNPDTTEGLMTTLYIDEAYALTDGQELPFYYKASLTRGRSIGLETWSGSQRPKDIPQFLMSESENKYIFYLEMPQDREKIRKMCGIPEPVIESLSMDNHEFIYRNLNRTTGKLRLKGIR